MLISRQIHWNFGPLPEKGDRNSLYVVVVKECKFSGWRAFTTNIYYDTFYTNKEWREIETDETIDPESVVCWTQHPYENIKDVVQKQLDKLNDL